EADGGRPALRAGGRLGRVGGVRLAHDALACGTATDRRRRRRRGLRAVHLWAALWVHVWQGSGWSLVCHARRLRLAIRRAMTFSSRIISTSVSAAPHARSTTAGV